MFSVNHREIEYDGDTSELLLDASMMLDVLYDSLEAELGHFITIKLLVKLLLLVFKRKRKERKCNTQNQ